MPSPIPPPLPPSSGRTSVSSKRSSTTSQRPRIPSPPSTIGSPRRSPVPSRRSTTPPSPKGASKCCNHYSARPHPPIPSPRLPRSANRLPPSPGIAGPSRSPPPMLAAPPLLQYQSLPCLHSLAATKLPVSTSLLRAVGARGLPRPKPSAPSTREVPSRIPVLRRSASASLSVTRRNSNTSPPAPRHHHRAWSSPLPQPLASASLDESPARRSSIPRLRRYLHSMSWLASAFNDTAIPARKVEPERMSAAQPPASEPLPSDNLTSSSGNETSSSAPRPRPGLVRFLARILFHNVSVHLPSFSRLIEFVRRRTTDLVHQSPAAQALSSLLDSSLWSSWFLKDTVSLWTVVESALLVVWCLHFVKKTGLSLPTVIKYWLSRSSSRRYRRLLKQR
ncbi:uncharacterized protein BJ171DRAFT_303897 [Polychytrium aggregatum]|uniref:uncharacterized protein n=1 Tax=Polychytrium aggregatum TaxID=110093 RepID=UPI0022FDCA2F|nr:uncharacterized protein BJ171DRAFT_303897 [Polychytrium aggregatum]KAI9193171.1 hypothetical protein BJ171DRAFT_303897 [Polychytrium aggregatum]